MDPSGILGIIGVVGQILAASVKIGLNWKDAPEDTKNFLSELEGLNKVLSETLNNIIKNPDFAAAFRGKQSSVLSSLVTSDDDSTLMFTCKKELDDLLLKLQKGFNSHRFGWERIKATFLNERTQTAVENLQRRCQMLNSIIAIDNTALTANTNLEVKSTRRELAEDRTSDLKRRILDWISPTDFETQQADNIERRQAGTGQWLLDSQQFQNWITNDRQTLFCPGMPGAGKTMVSSIVIEHLQQLHRDDKSIGLAYAFYNFRRQHEQSPREILSNLLRQLYQRQVTDCKHVQTSYKNHESGNRPLSTEEIATLIQQISSSFAKVYLVVDALDECQPNNGYRHGVLAVMLALHDSCNVNFLATSRHIPEIEAYFEGCSAIEIQATDWDVRTYLDGHISQLPSFVQRSRDLQEEIKASIVRNVEGMFLLAKLQLESLTGKRTPKAMRIALTKFATGSDAYDKAYNEAMERIEHQLKDQEDLAKDALSWIVCSRRPLTTLELQHALAIESETEELDEDNIPAIEDIISVCAGLVTVDEESKIIRLVHYTTQEYFERTKHRWLPDAEPFITVSCITYLSFNILSFPCKNWLALRHRTDANPLFKYVSENWGYHARSCHDLSEEVLKFLQGDQHRLESSFQFYHNERIPWTSPIYSTSKGNPRNGLHLAAHFGDWRHATVLLGATEDESYINTRDHCGETPLMYAIRSNETEMVQFLLKFPSIDMSGPDFLGYSPLHLAAGVGNEHIVDLFLQSGKVNIDARDPLGRTPLSEAAKCGHVGVVRRFLGTGKVDINSRTRDRSRDIETPLLAAVKAGHIGVVRFLIETGKADVNASDSERAKTPLSATSSLAMFRLLVEEGKADIDSLVNKPGETLLIQAARRNYEDIATYLVEKHQVDTEKKDHSGHTALSAAAGSGHLRLVRYLVEVACADINSRNAPGETPVVVAAKHGQSEVVKYLHEDCNTELNTRTSNGQTALSLASASGHLGVVQYLVQTGRVEINGTDSRGYTPLMEAVAGWKHQVVEYLLSVDGIEQSLHTKAKGMTPLECARNRLRPFNKEDYRSIRLLEAAEERCKGGTIGETAGETKDDERR